VRLEDWVTVRRVVTFVCVAGSMRKLLPRSLAGRRRLVVLSIAVVVAAFALAIAANTRGTVDVYIFRGFAAVIRHVGPVDIYGQHITGPPYNHPPLTGWLLVLINHLTDNGAGFAFLIRAPAILADIVTSVLVFELVRVRRPLTEATVAGVMVACSPALIIISGFHGNTDPIFVTFTLLSFYLLVNKRSGVLAGISFAAAISTKLVPVVALPLLVLVAARSGRRRLIAFAAGSAALLVPTWGPVLIRHFASFMHNVVEYGGYGNHPRWGLPEFAYAAGVSQHWMNLLLGPGRFAILLACAGVPLLIAWRRPTATTAAFGLTLVMFLLLSTATATQYLVWAVAAGFLINVWAAAVYNIAASILLTIVYDRWNNALPWGWDRTRSSPFTHSEIIIAGIVWMTLAAVAIAGLWTAGHESGAEGARSEAETNPEVVAGATMAV
jgi:Dolichyl-phosphate-mannose-protein mannosyltransferase